MSSAARRSPSEAEGRSNAASSRIAARQSPAVAESCWTFIARPHFAVIAVVLSPCCLPVAMTTAAMTYHDEFLDNDERPRSRRFAVGVVGVASVLRD